MQEISITDTQKAELCLNIENLGNRINSDWGCAELHPATYTVPVTSTTIADGQYNYDVDVENGQLVTPQLQLAKVPSVWKAQLGIYYRL